MPVEVVHTFEEKGNPEPVNVAMLLQYAPT